MAKPKTKSVAAERVPQSRDEAAAAIFEIGQHQRELTRIEAALGDAIAAVRAEHELDAQPHKWAIERLQRGVQTWCEAHRAELTDNGKHKTAAFPTGEVRWRLPPPSVTLKGVEAILKRLRDRGLHAFIRVKEEVSKEAILADPAGVKGIPGIEIKQVEEFVVVPHETVLEGAP